jgi:hypothetical protein
MPIISTSQSLVSGLPAGIDCAPHGAWLGYNGSAGYAQIFPAGGNKGYLTWSAANNASNYAITCVNASFGQATTVTLPDPGAAAANFTLDTGIVAAGVGASSPGSLTGVSDTLKVVRGGVTYYVPLYAVNT